MHLAGKTEAGGWPFGVDPKKVADELQAIVDGIREGAVVVRDARASQHTANVDFEEETLLITFTRKEL